MGPAGIIWPDVEALFVNHMSAALAARPEPVAAGVVVSAQRGTAARQVLVRDDGGPFLGDVRATARLGITVLAATRDDVVDLAALVVALVAAWPDGKPVVRVAALSRAYPISDESGVPARYVAAELVVRGTSL